MRIKRTKKSYSKKGPAQRALRKANYILKVMKPENKHVVHTGSGVSVGTIAQIIHLSAIPQSTNVSDRIGLKIRPRSIFGRLHFLQNNSATYTFYRIMFVVDLQQPASASFVIGDLLNSPDTLSPLATTKLGRFKVLYDKSFFTDDAKQLANYIKVNIPIKGVETGFNGAAAADIQRNGVYMFVLSDNSINAPTYSYNIKLNYTDV